MTPWRIVCDIGGTNIRYARARSASQLLDFSSEPVSGIRSVAETLRSFANRFDDLQDLTGIAIAAAGPVNGRIVSLTNHDLTIDACEISQAFNGNPVALINDLEAVAWSLPSLATSDRQGILEIANPLDGPQLVVNVGTGFGGAVLLRTAAGWHSMPCEPGHMKLAIPSIGSLEASEPFHLVSVEDVISGLALRDRARLSSQWGIEIADTDAEFANDIFGAIAKTARGVEFSTKFSALLGQVCGDLVVACGAWGGVNMCGSVVSAWRKQADISSFRTSFCDKGSMSERMERVAVSEIVNLHPALIGLRDLPLPTT